MSRPKLASILLGFTLLASVTAAPVPFTSSYSSYYDASTCISRSCVYVSSAGMDTGNGTISYPYRTIQQAFDNIVQQQNMGNMTAPLIVLDAGIYPGNIVWRGLDVSLTSAYGASVTIIRCIGSTIGISLINGESNNTVISGITVTDCNAFTGAGITIRGVDTAPIFKDIIVTNNTGGVGGGISVVSGHPEFHRVLMYNNSAPEGAGIAISTNILPILIRNCTIRDNNAYRAVAAGMSIRNAYVIIEQTIIQHNLAHQAGGIFTDSSRIRIYNSTIHDNQAIVDEGGGIWSVRSLIEIYDTVISSNRAMWNGAGIIFRLPRVWPSSMLTPMSAKYALQLYRVSFIDNSCGQSGGGVSIKEDHKLYAEDCLFLRNKGGDGGSGIYFTTDSDGYILRGKFKQNVGGSFGAALQWKNSFGTCESCEIDSNIVIPKPTPGSIWGGGVYISNSGVNFIGGTVTNNSADLGGGFAVVSKGSLTMTGTTIVNNVGIVSGGGIYVQQATLKMYKSNLYQNQGVNGAGLYIEKPSALVLTNNSITANRATQSGGGLYFSDVTSISYDLSKNNFTNNIANYGNNIATLQNGLSWIQPPVIKSEYTSNKTSITSLPSNQPISRITVQEITINNMDELMIDIGLFDAYGQQVNNTFASTIEVLPTITLTNQTNQGMSNRVPMEGSITHWSRYKLITGRVSGMIVLAGTPGYTYELGFTTTNTAILGIRLLVQIRPCQLYDSITYYPPGSHDYELCEPSDIQYISNGVFSSVIAISSIMSCLLFIVLGFIIYHWNHSVIKSSTPLFLILLMIGAWIAYIAIILMNVDINRLTSSAVNSRDSHIYDGMDQLTSICRSQYWLLSIACVLMFGTLVLKTHRISMIFCNSHLQVIPKHSTLRMCGILAIAVIIDMIINGIWLSVDPLTSQYILTTTNDHGVLTTSCQSQQLTMPLITIIYIALIVVACVWYGFKTRHVVCMFNESRQLMTASYNMAMCVLVTVILVSILPDPISRNLAFSYGSLFVTTSTWMIVLLPKLYIVITGQQPSSATQSHQTGGTTQHSQHQEGQGTSTYKKRTSAVGARGTTPTTSNLPNTTNGQFKRGSLSKLPTGLNESVDDNPAPLSPSSNAISPNEASNNKPLYQLNARSSMSRMDTPTATTAKNHI